MNRRFYRFTLLLTAVFLLSLLPAALAEETGDASQPVVYQEYLNIPADSFPTDPLTFEDLGLTLSGEVSAASASYLNPQTIVLSGKSPFDTIIQNYSSYTYPFKTTFTLNAGSMPQSDVWMAIRCWDVNEECDWTSHVEYDQVYVNDTLVGVLTGEGSEWNTTLLRVPLSALKSGTNTITVYVGMKFTESTTLNGVKYTKGQIIRDAVSDSIILPYGYWLMKIDQIQILCDGGSNSAKPDYFAVEIDSASFSGSTLVCKAVATIQSQSSKSYQLEYALLDNTSPSSATYGQIIASAFKSVSGSNITSTAQLSIPKSSPSGEYIVSVFLRDSNDVILATDEYAFDYTTNVLPRFDIKYLRAELSTLEYTNQDVTMNLTAQYDTTAGLSNIRCRLNGVDIGAMTIGSGGSLSKTLTISESGDYLVEIVYTKGGSQYTAKLYETVDNIDKTAPTITVTRSSSSRVTVTYQDDKSGVASAKYAITSTSAKPASSAYRTMPSSGSTISCSSSKYLHYILTDNAGNTLISSYPEAFTGWMEENGKWCYMINGVKLTDAWMQDSTGWVYLGSDGYMMINSWVMDSQGWCYVGSDGYVLTNFWVLDGGKWYYLDSTGHLAPNSWVYVDPNGVMIP